MPNRKPRLAILAALAATVLAAASPARTPRPKQRTARPRAATPTRAPSPEPTAAPEATKAPGAAEANAAPCTAPEYRQFDFWKGDWTVLGPDGKVAGENRVVPILNGCALQENWSGVKGSHGTSYNIYDKDTRRWHQTWVDDGGGLLQLDGELRDGRMILIGRRPSEKQKGVTITHRVAWTPLPGDKVRQFWEASPNEGRSWQVVFDGTYTRKK